jgi:hypothetical protein
VPSPQESEAAGFLHFTYRGLTVTTQLPSHWPLELIRRGRVIDAVQLILGDQFDEFLDQFPEFDDLTDFTNRLATEAGIPGTGAFGGIPALLLQLEFYADDVENILSANHHVSLVDYYRGDLTLRQVFVRLKQPWTRTHYLLADVFHALARQPHPDRPLSEMEKARAAAEKAEQERKEKVMREKEKQYANPAAIAAEKAQANALRELRRKGNSDEEV